MTNWHMRFILKFLITLVNTQTLYIRVATNYPIFYFIPKNSTLIMNNMFLIGILLHVFHIVFQLPLKQKLFQLLF
ncbi:hypothetical protein U753_09625 [Streptococcus pseudopneumoniae 5247]|nr:hypothetical protein U753_09625 [Streptococcus pseudopneumoniae 5247]